MEKTIVSLDPLYTAPAFTPSWNPDGCMAWIIERNGLGKSHFFRGEAQVITGCNLTSGCNVYFKANGISRKAQLFTLANIQSNRDFKGSTGNFLDYHIEEDHDIMFERSGAASTNLFLCEGYNRMTGGISSIMSRDLYSTKIPVPHTTITQSESKRCGQYIVISKGSPCIL